MLTERGRSENEEKPFPVTLERLICSAALGLPTLTSIGPTQQAARAAIEIIRSLCLANVFCLVEALSLVEMLSVKKERQHF